MAALMAAAPIVAAGLSIQPAKADPVAKPLSVQVGVGSFTGNAGNRTERTGVHAGASYAMTSSPDIPGSRYGVDVDENYNSRGGSHMNVAGVTLAARVPLQTATAGKPLIYGGLGLGAFNLQGHNMGTGTTSFQKTNFGGKAMVGVDTGRAFVEGSYIVAGSASGVRADSVNLGVGMHF